MAPTQPMPDSPSGTCTYDVERRARFDSTPDASPPRRLRNGIYIHPFHPKPDTTHQPPTDGPTANKQATGA